MNKDLLIVLERTITLLKHQATEDEIRAVIELVMLGHMKEGTLTEEAIALNKKLASEEFAQALKH
jgi:hypothetical protein